MAIILYSLLGLLSLALCLAFAGATRLAIKRRHKSWVTTAWASVISGAWVGVAVRGLVELSQSS